MRYRCLYGTVNDKSYFVTDIGDAELSFGGKKTLHA